MRMQETLELQRIRAYLRNADNAADIRDCSEDLIDAARDLGAPLLMIVEPYELAIARLNRTTLQMQSKLAGFNRRMR